MSDKSPGQCRAAKIWGSIDWIFGNSGRRGCDVGWRWRGARFNLWATQ